MSIWTKIALYSLAGAILGSMIIGTLFSGTGTMNGVYGGTFGVPTMGSYGGYSNTIGYVNGSPFQQGGYMSNMKMGTGMNNSRCMNRK